MILQRLADGADLSAEPLPGQPIVEIAGDRLVAHGQPVDIVYRRALINDIVARPDDTRVLVEAYRRGLVCMANTLRCKIPHKKSFFAVLTDEKHAARFSDA